MLSIMQVAAVLWLLSLLACCGLGYKLQHTIHTLREENLHMQHRLENLTQALRDLKHLLKDSSKGMSAETHQMFEQALCLLELHGAARVVFSAPGVLFLSPFISVILLLLP